MQANTTSLLSIQRLDPIYANFTITERDLPEELALAQAQGNELNALVQLYQALGGGWE